MMEIKKDSARPQERDMAKEYLALRQKYSLPELAELDREFALGNLEPTTFILRTIMDKIHDRLDFMIKILGNLVQPESHVSDMNEAESLTDEEKKGVYELFKRVIRFEKEFIIADFNYSDESAAQLINKLWKDWKIMKADFLRVLSRTRDAWGKEGGPKQEFGYFG